MGVYINIEMPKCCAECDIEGYYENSYGMKYGFFCPLGYKEYTEDTRDAKRLDNCPLVPVPPHGDLIDRNKLGKDIDKYIGGEESRSRFHHWVQVQRTVIPESEEAHT